MQILVTGGMGYIGSHTVVELITAGYEVIILDNLSNSKKEVLDKLEIITKTRPKFYYQDMLDKEGLRQVFLENDIQAVIDFAAYKAVGESVSKPLEYYNNNVVSVLTLLEVMREFNCLNLVFSSSATVYGSSLASPIKESAKVGNTTNPYGTSKLFVEEIIKDVCKAYPNFNATILRYFNPLGAHESALIGEIPNGVPANIMPYLVKVVSGNLECLTVFGNDYNTKDGTGVRDYIHISDLARGHILALNKMLKDNLGLHIYNLGTGTGYSVLELINTFEEVTGLKVNYKIGARRAGDIDECYADITKAKQELGYIPLKNLQDMCLDAWNFESKK